MIIIADTSPINYLILIGKVELLSHLFSIIVIPEAVHIELQHAKAPEPVRNWVENPPQWLEIRKVQRPIEPSLLTLGAGEREAIMLAEDLGAYLLLVDERKGYEAAVKRNLRVAGTLFVLEEAAIRGLINLPDTLTSLQKTSFRITQALIQNILNRVSAQKPRE